MGYEKYRPYSPQQVQHLTLQSRANGTHRSTPQQHEAISDKSTVVVRVHNLPTGGSLTVRIYDSADADHKYWDLAEEFTVDSTNLADPLSTGYECYHESIGHPLAPWIMVEVVVTNGPIEFGVDVITGL